ncbi:synaptonemal complex protein 2-like [Boleophthalmus pectinirostris]|uniref:synaptonemal complex protein 2-like n=1 Tax=Boleophthalmus pectinirostris TaxID=150288 RepID=UPI002431A111|nr:synaptonemal complex protein 2-like [Boleophthalmus pectinirostris]
MNYRMFKLKILKYLEKGDSLGLVSLLRKEGLGRGTLTQLHQLVTTELSSERFSRVQLVVKALDKLCENSKALQTLLTSGLISKLLWWYECVFDKLTSDLSHSTALKNLTGAFFDYFLELVKPSVPVSELRVILMYLCRTALDPTVAFKLRLEAIRTFNSCVDSSSPEQRRVLQAHCDIKCILSDMAGALFTAGDYELQASITETLCRLTLKLDRPVRAKEWFVPELSLAFTAIRNPYFEADCRQFLNFLNRTQGDQRRVYTFPCLQALLDSTQLRRPEDEDVTEFWIDFNLGSECVSFFLDNPNKETCSLWESIHVLRTEVNRYSLTEVNRVAVLHMDLIRPMFLEDLRGQRLEIRFKADLLGELSHVICRVFKRPSVPVSFMRTYSKKTPKRKLRVLPLSSPSSEEDSAVKSPETSRAEILFDQIQHSTPAYKCGVRWEEQGHDCSSTSTAGLAGSVRKRPFSDSGYLTDTIRTPKRVQPSSERARSPAQRRRAKEEEPVHRWMELDAEEEHVHGSVGHKAEEEAVDLRVELDGEEEQVDRRMELDGEEEQVDRRMELGAEQEHLDGRVELGAEEKHVDEKVELGAEEERVGGRVELGAEEKRVDGKVERVDGKVELGAEEKRVDGRVELGAEEKRVDGRVGLGAEEEHIHGSVGLDAEEDSLSIDRLAEELGPEMELAQSRAEGAGLAAEKEVESASEGPGAVATGGRSLADKAGCLSEEGRPAGEVMEFLENGAELTAKGMESHAIDKESVAEEKSVIELEPGTFKLEWSAGGADLPEQVDLQVINSTESLVFEQSEELRANTDIIANFKSLFEQQITSQWQQVENQVVQFQRETHKRLSELLSAFEEHRAVHEQMLRDTVWNWKALEDFHSISSGITYFMKSENQRVTSFCQQHILRLKKCEEMERASEKGGSSTVQK